MKSIVFPAGHILIEASNAPLAYKLGLQTRASRTFHDAIHHRRHIQTPHQPIG
jgi:hypothetical protein